MADNYAEVKRQFDEKRDLAYALAEARRGELRGKSDEYKLLDDAQNGCMAELMHLMQDLSKDHGAQIANIKEEMKLLRSQKEAVLEKLGLPKDHDRVKFECDKCEDTGFIGIDVCDCFKKALRMENYLSSGLGKALVRQKFENFELDLYPAEVRADMEKVFDYVRDYAEHFSKNSPSLLFIGGTGLGKTHLSSALAMKVLDAGYDVVYDTAQSVFSAFEKNRFNRDDKETPRYTECELLIMDDLGSEMNSQAGTSTLYNILNARMNSELPTVISTNLSPNELRAKYDSRIISRLFGQFGIMQFTGRDIRMEKLKNL